MDGLVQFLRARLDEDEALAREAPAGPWHIGNAVDPTQPCSVHTFPSVRLVADGLNWLVAEHIAHHNPARVLREIDAKRGVVDRYEFACKEAAATDIDEEERETRVQVAAAFQSCTLLLASVYADRPGYREEWRP